MGGEIWVGKRVFLLTKEKQRFFVWGWEILWCAERREKRDFFFFFMRVGGTFFFFFFRSKGILVIKFFETIINSYNILLKFFLFFF